MHTRIHYIHTPNIHTPNTHHATQLSAHLNYYIILKMNPHVSVVYKTGEHKGKHSGYCIQEGRKDGLILWEDGTVNTVQKDIITYDESAKNDLLVKLYNNQITMEQTIKKLSDNLVDTTTELNEFKAYMTEYMNAETENRKALMAVINQLKQNQHNFASPKKNEKRKRIEGNTAEKERYL